jgi:hypothetical protein
VTDAVSKCRLRMAMFSCIDKNWVEVGRVTDCLLKCISVLEKMAPAFALVTGASAGSELVPF